MSGIHFLGMANVGLTDEISITARVSGENCSSEDMLLSVTISPSYTKNDNWDALLEVKPHLSENCHCGRNIDDFLDTNNQKKLKRQLQ